ncbi:thiol:disulfide interchange protein [Sphingorhabdus pulchriflava]|uniref:Thiol:disulfide interchange protein n=1 Tax=Sphingorhabdus pulchriflava TaxID=2292257 RepID=A0A371B4G5_9SPHN|nr:protein-disulfide reductase DsbD domain-containing protein [Sphingorhabdus pulchriflava]RDV02469.1 thiol:disulfide interchange protein [Sphingorhabdus pulchriflava]
MPALIRWLLLCLALLAAQASIAQELNVPGRLVAETETPKPGSNVTLAFVFEPKPGWHGYWENPGDAGLGLQLEWNLPAGVSAGKLHFPVPKPLLIGGLMNHVYEAPHAVLVDLSIPSTAQLGDSLPIEVAANWLACTDKICVPQQGRFTLRLKVGDGVVDRASRTQFDQWRAAIPVPLDQPARYAIDGKNYLIAIPYPESAPLDRPYFFALTADRVRYAAPQTARRIGNWLVIETEAQGQAGPAEGLLRIGNEQGLLISSVAGNIPAGGLDVPTLGATDKLALSAPQLPGLPWLLLGALLGGMLLNLMPCVFPILGLKALAMAKAGGEESEARRDALAYTAGVGASCLALGAIMLSLRAAGEEIGWAFQLQEPIVVLGLLLLMVAITANLAGLFELNGVAIGDGLTRSAGLSGSFWTGVLAAVVATPCTGPFMAAAMGAAILLPASEAMLLFTALGFGIAAPFLLIAYVPPVRRLLPGPGAWLSRFRMIMAIPMGLTALALLWLMWRLSDQNGLLVGIASLLAMLVVIAGYRWAQFRLRLAPLILLLGGAAILLAATRCLPDADRTSSGKETAFPGAVTFDADRLSGLRNAGKPVFLYFTADWCVTCKVNEAAAINREETVRLFRKKSIQVMVGDFTRRDPAIARFLADRGRSGVPLYLFYPAQGEPRELPQLLTPATIADAIAE